MAYLVLARKYRPGTFETFVGQEVIAETLRNAIRLNRVAHAYLFCGPRGVGKTSMARVFAKALNCVNGPTTEPCGKCEQCKAIAAGQDVDVIEIDGASNRGIDEVRDIRQNVRYAPAHSRLKIYYIDEVHMLTEPAFNALLKTLEEPPSHVKFILATTAAAKLPETILSRVQRFDFRRISNTDIARHLDEVCKTEKLKMPADVLALVARRARGSMRDALSLLDEIIPLTAPAATSGKETAAEAAPAQSSYEKVAGLLGTLSDEEMARLMKMIHDKDAAGLLRMAAELLGRGMDVGELLDELVGYARDLLVGTTCGPDPELLDRPPDAAAALVAVGKGFSPDRLLYIAEILNGARRRIREGQDDRIVLEMALVKLAQSDGLAPIGELIERLAAIEEGAAPVAARSVAKPSAARSLPQGGSGGSPEVSWRAAAESEVRSVPAVREEATASAVPPAGGEPEDLWRRFLDEAQKKDVWLYAQVGGGHLERAADGEVVIGFAADRASARRELEEQGNRRKLQAILEQLLNRPVTLRFVTVAGEPPRKNPGEAALNDAGIQELVKKFAGRIEG